MKLLLVIHAFIFLWRPILSQDSDSIYNYSYPLPILSECQDAWPDEDNQFIHKCSKDLFLKNIYPLIRYPKKAREKGMTGKVVASFVIRKTGFIDDIKILKDLGGGLGLEVLRCLNVLAKKHVWIPGQKDGKIVSVRLIVPVTFRIGGFKNSPIRDVSLKQDTVYSENDVDRKHFLLACEKSDIVYHKCLRFEFAKLLASSDEISVAEIFKNNLVLRLSVNEEGMIEHYFIKKFDDVSIQRKVSEALKPLLGRKLWQPALYKGDPVKIVTEIKF